MTWWRKNRVGVIALATSLLAVGASYGVIQIAPAFEKEAQHVSVVAGTGQIAGQTLTLRSATAVDDEDAVAGTQTYVVEFDARPDGDADRCTALRLIEEGSGRTWVGSRPSRDAFPGEAESTCTGADAPYRIAAAFRLPDDASGPFRVEIRASGSPSNAIAFPITP